MNDYIEEEIETLKTLTCIQKMGNKYLGLWEKLVDRYAPRLNDSPIIKKVAYTSHDFSYHCKNIYSNMDNILLDGVDLTQEEYFVLNVAVLMHDISMTEGKFDRLIHSQQSAEYIDKEVEKQEDVWQEVPGQHLPIIKNIVLAHSDIKEKDSNGKERVKTYTLRELPEVETGEVGKKVHTRWLAGILRLADELDITQARCRNGDKRYLNLNDEDEEENFSRLRWEELQYFKKIEKKKADIELVLNETYLKGHINDDRKNIIERIKRVWNKTIKCLQEVNEYAFDSCDDYINKIKIKTIVLANNDIFNAGELDEDLGRNGADTEELLIELKKK